MIPDSWFFRRMEWVAQQQEDNSYTETFPQGIAAERAMIPHDEHLTYFRAIRRTQPHAPCADTRPRKRTADRDSVSSEVTNWTFGKRKYLG